MQERPFFPISLCTFYTREQPSHTCRDRACIHVRSNSNYLKASLPMFTGDAMLEDCHAIQFEFEYEDGSDAQPLSGCIYGSVGFDLLN